MGESISFIRVFMGGYVFLQERLWLNPCLLLGYLWVDQYILQGYLWVDAYHFQGYIYILSFFFMDGSEFLSIRVAYNQKKVW